MKILHIYKTYYPESIGGVETTISQLSKKLHEQNIVSDVAVTTPENFSYESMDNNSRVYFFSQAFDLFSCPVSARMFKQYRTLIASYDILHYHFPWPFADLLHIGLKIKKPAILTFHADIVRQALLKPFYAPLMHAFLKKMQRIVVTSKNLLHNTALLEKYKARCEVVPIGIELSSYPQPAPALLEEWRNKIGARFFLFIGTLRYYKGLHFLLEALKESDAFLVIAGSGPEEENLKKLAAQYHLSNVLFLGKIDEATKAALLHLCFAVIAPSHLRAEAFCISLLEGLMYGKPLISTELGTGTSFVNQHNATGLVVPPKSANALREAMKILLTDAKLYDKLQRGALDHYRQHFTAERMGKHYINLYQGLLATS